MVNATHKFYFSHLEQPSTPCRRKGEPNVTTISVLQPGLSDKQLGRRQMNWLVCLDVNFKLEGAIPSCCERGS